jgi:hypothetical protein
MLTKRVDFKFLQEEVKIIKQIHRRIMLREYDIRYGIL